MFTTNAAFSVFGIISPLWLVQRGKAGIINLKGFLALTWHKLKHRIVQHPEQHGWGHPAGGAAAQGMGSHSWLHLQDSFQAVLRFNYPKNCETFRNPSSAKSKRMLVSGTVVMHLLQKLRACEGVQMHEIRINIFPFCSSLGIEPQKCNIPP